MKRHRSRRQSAAQKLNLVALMDIFTILVFFLMVNSSDVQIKDTHDSVALPKSTTTQLPEDTLKLYITKNYMFFDESNDKIMLDTSSDSSNYPQLIAALRSIAQAQGELPEAHLDRGRAITILGDQDTEYTTIEKVLASCAQTEFRDVSLAVIYRDHAGEPQAGELQARKPQSVTDLTTASR